MTPGALAKPPFNTLTWIERNTLAPHHEVLDTYYLPVMQIETGPSVFNLLVRDTVPAPFHVQQAIRIPLTKLVCARFISIYDTSRLNTEALETLLTFEVPPYRFQGINVEARIQPEMPAALPTYGAFPLRMVVPTPTVLAVPGGDLYLWSRANPNPPIYGLRAIAWAADVQYQLTPERLQPGTVYF